jgi:hypothetical protein
MADGGSLPSSHCIRRLSSILLLTTDTMNRPAFSLLSLLLAATLAACSSTSDPTPTVQSPPVKKRDYDPARGGVQITAIYYDQAKNSEITGVNDEWIVLESQNDTPTTGWHLDAGDIYQFYDLPETLHRRLYIYTRAGVGTSDTTMALGLSRWIWNNEDPDTARLYDADGSLVDTFTY